MDDNKRYNLFGFIYLLIVDGSRLLSGAKECFFAHRRGEMSVELTLIIVGPVYKEGN